MRIVGDFCFSFEIEKNFQNKTNAGRNIFTVSSGLKTVRVSMDKNRGRLIPVDQMSVRAIRIELLEIIRLTKLPHRRAQKKNGTEILHLLCSIVICDQMGKIAVVLKHVRTVNVKSNESIDRRAGLVAAALRLVDA